MTGPPPSFFGGTGVPPSVVSATVVVEEQPAEALVELARQRDARAIIVGTHGESPLKGAILGSTPHKLLQLSDRPVLVVPAPDGA